jgi:hypothetical protein
MYTHVLLITLLTQWCIISHPVTNDYVTNLSHRWTLLKAEMKSKCTFPHLQAYDDMTTMDDNLEDKWCTCLRQQNDKWCTFLKQQTPNEWWSTCLRRQMMHIIETTNTKWHTCLRRQTPNDAHSCIRIHTLLTWSTVFCSIKKLRVDYML